MKTRSITLFIFFLLLLQTIYSQKYRTLEQYQEYFINNYKSIDKIEGIWYVYTKIMVDNIKLGKYTEDLDPELVAIIKEGSSFKQYTIKDGYYFPVSGTREFKSMNNAYTYVRYYDDIKRTFYGKQFYLYNDSKKFSFEMSILEKAKNEYQQIGANPNNIIQAVYTYSYSKFFPLESDILDNKTKEIRCILKFLA